MSPPKLPETARCRKKLKLRTKSALIGLWAGATAGEVLLPFYGGRSETTAGEVRLPFTAGG